EPARNRRLDAVADAEEPLGRALAGAELGVRVVDVAREEVRGERVGARHHKRRNTGDVRREPRRVEGADGVATRDEHFAAEGAALLLRRELILEVDGGSARLDER